MNIPNPRNVSDALTQARVNERSQRLFEDGYRATFNADDDVIVIVSDEGNQYRVNILFEQCNCPFFVKNDFCKHALGAQKLLQQSVAEQQEIEEANALELDVDTYRRHKAEIDGDPFYGE